jgi:hypothetical protein
MRPAVRLNATSDQPKMALRMAEQFPNIQFYDYTKIKEVFDWSLPKNYYPTFSRSETNWDECVEILDGGGNVAVVFTNRPNYYKGHEVINGDESDLRFLDKRGVIVGLSAKGKGKKDNTGFVVRGNGNQAVAPNEPLKTEAHLMAYLLERDHKWYTTFKNLLGTKRDDARNGLMRRINASRSVGTPPRELYEAIDEILSTHSHTLQPSHTVEKQVESLVDAIIPGEHHIHEKTRSHGKDAGGEQRWSCFCGKTFTEHTQQWADGRLIPRPNQEAADGRR